jgi:type II secretory pathway pseudopilin PulG
MEIGSKIRERFDALTEFLNGQEWFQQLKAMWDELDLQAKTYIKLGTAALGVLILLGVVFTSMWQVRNLRTELSAKQELLSMIQSASQEMSQLKAQTGGLLSKAADPGTMSWSGYFEGVAASSGIEKGNITTDETKSDPTERKPEARTQETLSTITLRKINIKQLTQFAFQLENSKRIVKIRNLSVDTKNDPTGYLEAVFAVSGLSILPEK